MTRWEYFTAPILVHASQQILNNFGADGWELVQIVAGPNPDSLAVSYTHLTLPTIYSV